MLSLEREDEIICYSVKLVIKVILYQSKMYIMTLVWSGLVSRYVNILGFIEEGGRAEGDPRVLYTLILNLSDGNLGGSCLDKIKNLRM